MKSIIKYFQITTDLLWIYMNNTRQSYKYKHIINFLRSSKTEQYYFGFLIIIIFLSLEKDDCLFMVFKF